jgi:hypothetical protein
MANLQQAIDLATRAHQGQADKVTGVPYITHPLRVMDAVGGTAAKMVGVLHDVLEDTPVTAADLRAAGFSEQVVAGVLAVTRLESESYAQFVVRCKGDALGRQVKLADLKDNFNLPRTLVRLDRLRDDFRRLLRYALSFRYLLDEMTDGEYLAAMEEVDRLIPEA